MIDRRFLDVRLTVNGYAASAPSSPNSGDQYIVTEVWSGHPESTVNSIASYNNGWTFTKPNAYRSLEVINIATGELLKYSYDGSNTCWHTVSTLGGLILPYVVDTVISDARYLSETYGKIGLTYICLGQDNKVWKVTGSGESARTAIATLSVGDKVGIISNGYIYTVKANGESAAFDSNSDYIPAHTLVLSARTQCAYLSSNSEGNALISLTPHRATFGESQGSIVMERHVFTAEEISAKQVYLNNTISEENLSKVICVMNGSVHMASDDFSANRDSDSHYLYISWNDSYMSWEDSSPRVNEVGIFIYPKE